MFRADRFSRSQSNDNTRFPVVLGVAIIVFTVIGVACSVDDDRSKPTTTTASVPAVAPAVTDSAQPPTSVASAPVTFASAQEAYTNRHYSEATAAFSAYVLQHPANGYGYYMLGLSAWKSGDLDRAREALEHSLSIDSTNVKTLLNLGRVLLDQHHVDEALACVTKAVALDSTSAEVHRMMARVQDARGERDSAMASYRVALSIDPADSWSMNNLGLLLIESGRYADALPPLARAVELRPEAPAFANNLGVALERNGQPAEAAAAFRAALAADSTYAKASVSLARVERQGVDSVGLDVTALAAAFNEELQVARRERLMAKAVIKPDTLREPER